VRAICGVFRTDGVAVDREQLVAMGAAAPLPDPGTVRTWVGDGVGFAWLGGPKRAVEEEDVVLVADASLHDRAGLLAALDAGDSKAGPLGDLDLILRAYRRWGDVCPAHLVGDFALALFDRRRRRLLLARDPFGARPLSLHRRDGLVVFGTWMHAVLAHPDVPRRIDEARVADSFIDHLEALDATTTFYEGIERLPPAHVLAVEARRVTQERYWRLALDPAPPTTEVAAQVAGLRDALVRAVTSRLEAHPGAGLMLSGGVDSIAVACLAREHRSRTGAGELPTFSGVLSDPAACTEGPYARAVVADGGLAPTWICPTDVARYQPAIRRVLETTEDLFDVSMLELRTVMYAEAARQGVPALLDGVDGNLVVSHDAEALGFLVRRGRWGEAWRVAGGLGRFYGTSRLGLFWTYGLRTLRPEALARWKRSLLPTTAHDALVRASLVSPDLAERVDLRGRLARRLHPVAGPEAALRDDPQAYHRHNLESALIPCALERYARAAAWQGLEATHPFFDRRVVAAALALPFETKTHGGWPKGALRTALAGSAPREVLWRRAAHNLSTDFWRATLGQVEDLIADLEGSRFSEIGHFADVGKFNEALVRWRREGCVVSGVRVLRVAALASWLRRSA
jgi:asparagine synthase (glutamine-hydrolysing)